MPRPTIHHARPILGCCLAALLGLTAVVPAPATAQQQSTRDQQLSQVLGALLIAGGIAKVIDDRNDRRDERRDRERRAEEERRAEALRAAEAQRYAEEQRRIEEQRRAEARSRHDLRPLIEPGRQRRGMGARTLPASCLRDVTGGRRPERVVEARCLQRADVRTTLPTSCARLVEVAGRFRTMYGAQCLSDQGYRFR